MAVELDPAGFSLVLFDPAELRAVVERTCEQLGMADLDVRVEVDETTPLGRAKVASVDPVVLSIESGALEDPKRPRKLSPQSAADVIGRLLMRVRDRRDPAFGDPPPDEELDLALSVAWDVYCTGRLARLGYKPQRKRRLYHFRNRHGFTDAADVAFDRLWTAEQLNWQEIVDLSRGAVAVEA